MSRISGYFWVASALALMIGVSSLAQAQVVSNFSGNIDGSEPESYEVDDETCTVIEPAFHHYETFAAYVTTTGSYDYSDLSITYDLDMQLTIYNGPYNPSSVLDNCVTRFDDSGTVDLTAGQNYVFVVQPLFDGSLDTGVWEFEMSGPGQVIQGIAEARSVPTLSSWSLMIMMFLSFVIGGFFVSRR